MLSGDRYDYADDFTNTRLHELPVYIKYRFSETDFHMNYHFHRGYELFFLHEGMGAYINDDYVHPFQGNDLILIEGRQIHKASPTIGRRFSRTVINFLPECLIPESKQLVHDLFGRKLGNESRHLLLSEEKHARIYALLHQIHAEYTERHMGFQHMIGILLTRLLQDIHRIRFSDRPPSGKDIAEDNPAVQPIIDYLSSHYAENIPLEELAKMFYITPYYLCRLFKRATGDTIGRFITYARIRQAKQELVFTDMSITEICTRVGMAAFPTSGTCSSNMKG